MARIELETQTTKYSNYDFSVKHDALKMKGIDLPVHSVELHGTSYS